MSRIARSRSFSNTMSAGSSRATMRSKTVGSVDMPTILRLVVPQRPVRPDALIVPRDAVGGEELVLPAPGIPSVGLVIPVEAEAGDGQVGPRVGDTELTQVDVPGRR